MSLLVQIRNGVALKRVYQSMTYEKLITTIGSVSLPSRGQIIIVQVISRNLPTAPFLIRAKNHGIEESFPDGILVSLWDSALMFS